MHPVSGVSLLVICGFAFAGRLVFADPNVDPSSPWRLSRTYNGYTGPTGGNLDEQSYYRVMEMIDRLGPLLDPEARGLALENAKRGLDLGMSRGFSGSQAAKHLMGLAAANYAGGPGRRRRSPH